MLKGDYMKYLVKTAAVLLLTAGFVSCASTKAASASKKNNAPAVMNTSTKTGMDAIPADALAAAKGIDSEEQNATNTFANAVIAPWALNGNKNYIQDKDLFINTQYEGDDWAKDITKDKLTLVDVGDGDKALCAQYNLSGDSHLFSFLMNISEQGAKPQDISHTVVTMRVYIPEELVLDNADGFNSSLKFAIRDSAWGQHALGGDLAKFTFKDIGSGWQTITLNFERGTFDLGNKKGTFTADKSTMAKCNMIDLYIQGKKVSSNLNVPILI